MSDLTNFIPGTVQACRDLLGDLRGQTTFTLADRYGEARTLGPDEIDALVALIENQIGEDTPKPRTRKKTKR